MINVQFSNNKDVTADWTIRRPMEKIRDWAFFTCVPTSGTLLPGEKVNMQIFFEPTTVRDEYAQVRNCNRTGVWNERARSTLMPHHACTSGSAPAW